MPVTLTPIPWRYAETSVVRAWVWTTPHFQAQVLAEPSAFAWEVENKVAVPGAPGLLGEGRAPSFAAAEEAVREVIGKSFPLTAGYGDYAGALAKTFTTVGGIRTDFTGYEGERCLVTVLMPDGTNRSWLGVVHVVHYEIQVDPSTGPSVRIHPSHIAKIAREAGGPIATSTRPDYLGSGRLYRGTVTYGCTGTPSFLDGVVDHVTAGLCPVHESNLDAGRTLIDSVSAPRR